MSKLDAVGTAQDHFALMLHDRIIDLEQRMALLTPPPLDPKITVLGTTTVADTRTAFLRIRSARALDIGQLMGRVLDTMGDVNPTRWDAWCCQHWSCLLHQDAFVTEMVVQQSGVAGLDVTRVAHAALDATKDLLRSVEMEHTARVSACVVKCPTWFVESVRTANTATGQPAKLYTWDPVARAMVTSDTDEIDETGMGGGGTCDHQTWIMMHGWLASQLEITDLWHPKALNAAASGLQFTMALRRVCG